MQIVIRFLQATTGGFQKPPSSTDHLEFPIVSFRGWTLEEEEFELVLEEVLADERIERI